MTYMVNQNKKIKGIIIGREIKLCQFADDTTLILDGSKESLDSALNTIEIFGSISGLKMNTTKTKLVWIGRKKYCREKINTSFNLEWGSTTFDLLGITFSVNLNLFIYLGFYIAFNTVQVISRQVVGRTEETST